jgi:hypothetical protein
MAMLVVFTNSLLLYFSSTKFPKFVIFLAISFKYDVGICRNIFRRTEGFSIVLFYLLPHFKQLSFLPF